MKHYFQLTAIILIMAVRAIAQAPATFNSAEGNAFANITLLATDTANANIRVLPNPSSGMIVLMLGDANTNAFVQGQAIVYNGGGQPVAQKSYTTGTNNIYVGNLSNGMYFLRVMPKNGVAVVKGFVVAR